MKTVKTYFKFQPFSLKQRKVLNWWCDSSPVRDKDGIIADGAIRSGKTVSMSLSFVLWAMSNFSGNNFAMCGKTIGSFRRNVLFCLKLMLKSRGFKVEDKRSENLIIVSRNGTENYFYIFGGKDERSQDLIQGITLAGLFCDEVALMPESFVKQAVARCSVDGSKFWFNCNPDNPSHFFKAEWIDKAKDKNLIYIHFTMDDNLSLTEKIKERYRNSFAGVFFKRYILGLWVPAEGVIYNLFADKPEEFIIDEAPDDIVFCNLGQDFGGNGSAHAIILTGFSKSLQNVVILDEYYRKGIMSPTELENAVCDFIRTVQHKYNVHDLYCDSAEQVLIQGIRQAIAKEKLTVNIHNARKSEILGRIRFTNMIMSQRRFYVMRHCEHVIEAFQSALWDSKKMLDTRLDDGTTNVDSLDAFEYSVEKYMNKIIKAGVINDK